VSPLIKKTDESAPKVLPRALIAASAEARRLLEEAETRAAAIVRSAEDERARAREEGFARGYEEGAARWTAATRAAQESVRGLMALAREEVLRLAMRVAEKILRQRIEVAPESILPMIDEALRSLQAQPQLRVVLRVHPDDRPLLEARRPHWLDHFPAIATLTIAPDETIGRGGCRIESEHGTVDATIQTQIRVIERHLLGRGDDTP
jgi:type III secretion system HrpE/YscL family protein